MITPNGSGGEYVEYHHPDRLGTRIVTNNAGSSYYEQTTLPFGTALDAESTGATNRFEVDCYAVPNHTTHYKWLKGRYQRDGETLYDRFASALIREFHT